MNQSEEKILRNQKEIMRALLCVLQRFSDTEEDQKMLSHAIFSLSLIHISEPTRPY